MLEQLLAQINNLGLQLTDQEVADIIWLSTQMNSQNSGDYPVTDTQKQFANNYSDDIERQKESINILLSHQAITNPLMLARGLRPLMRKVPSKSGEVLDVEATVIQIAEREIWLPVLKPSPERWLDLALVIDEGTSMEDWKNTIREFQNLLEHYGIFRCVQTWGFVSDTNSEVTIYLKDRSETGRQSVRDYREIIEPTGRKLILVVSDCVSLCWQNGAILPTLKIFAESNNPTAILQVLTEPLWIRSSLGLKKTEKFSSLIPGTPNKRLVTKESNLAGLKMPIVTLEPASMKNWAKLIAGFSGTQIDGFLIDNNTFANDESFKHRKRTRVLSEKERTKWFQVTALPRERMEKGL